MNTLQFLLNLQQSKNKISTNNKPSNNRMNSMGDSELVHYKIMKEYLHIPPENTDNDD